MDSDIRTRTLLPRPRSPIEDEVQAMLRFFGIDPNKLTSCPACGIELIMRAMLPHLNNNGGDMFGDFDRMDSAKVTPNHSWTFKQIGKWLEEIGY